MVKVVLAAAAGLAVAAQTVSAGMAPRSPDMEVRSVNDQQEKGERKSVEKRLMEESMAEEWQREGDEYLPLPGTNRLPAAGPSQSLQILGERLHLTHDQQNRIRQILNRKVILVRTVARDAALSARQKREKAAAILEEEYGKIRKLLTEQQRKEFDDLRRR